MSMSGGYDDFLYGVVFCLVDVDGIKIEWNMKFTRFNADSTSWTHLRVAQSFSSTVSFFWLCSIRLDAMKNSVIVEDRYWELLPKIQYKTVTLLQGPPGWQNWTFVGVSKKKTSGSGFLNNKIKFLNIFGFSLKNNRIKSQVSANFLRFSSEFIKILTLKILILFNHREKCQISERSLKIIWVFKKTLDTLKTP